MFFHYLKTLCCLIGAAFGLCFLYVAFSRCDFPYLIEWMEGGSLQQASYFLSHLKVYPEPSVDYLPYIYTPLYVYVSALLIKVFPATLMTLRLASVAMTIATAGLIYLIVKHITNAKAAAFIGAMLYLASFELTGCFMDIARADSLQVLLMMSALYFHFKSENAAKLWIIITAVLYTLAIFCKQPSLLFFLIVAGGLAGRSLYYKHRKSRDIQIFLLAFALIVCSFSLLFYLEPWAFWYIIDVPKNHKIYPRAILSVLKPLVIFLPLYVSCFLYKVDDPKSFNLHLLFLLGIGCLVTGMLPSIKAGGYSNNLMPIIAGFCISAGVAIRYAETKLKYKRDTILPILGGVYLLQFLSSLYSPFSMIPSADNKQKAKAFVDRLASTDGEVFSVFEGYLNVILGRGDGQFHLMPLNDISQSYPKVSEEIYEQLRSALVAKKFSAVLDEFDCFNTMKKELTDNYVLAPNQNWINHVKVMTGMDATPGNLWLRK